MSLGSRLKTKRKQLKFTQVDVAKRLGIDNTTVSKWESDTYEPDIDTLKKLADLYQTTTDFLSGKEPLSLNNPSASNDNEDSRMGLAFITGGDDLTEEEVEYLKESLELFRRMKEKRAKEREK
ncbi:helix-turn-helix domain-containing protein [Brevibacillus choshinensis]|uniref:Helix-turn-helix domain-containing protein n=1 Tax=Brevibacillus choshinensis TaxID=54911 RepID=A0ABX7FI61_BRECH|nr:helix-turn-helix domain-containing protein [Brevibacillus choshinensis]QRG65285.1 helix-turn-helix domain-containing protein [Brevibacillus choshinensis]